MQEQIIMDEFELGRTRPVEAEAPNQNHLYYLNKIFRISRKYHSRAFLSSLKSCVLRALISTVQRPPAPPRPFCPPESTLQFQFVSMCASKIQAIFRGYLTRKYYLQASKRLKQFKASMSALVAGWKTRRIMRCNKMQEAMGVIRAKRREVLKQRQNIERAPNSYSHKKLEYLVKSLRQEISLLLYRFQDFYESDAWVFEPRVYLPALPTTRMAKKHLQEISELHQQKAFVEQKIEQIPVKPKRNRQMRDRNRKPQKTQRNDGQEEVESERVEKASMNRGQPSNKAQIEGQGKITKISECMEDRPIKAKGSYQLQEKDLINQQPPQNHKQTKKVSSSNHLEGTDGNSQQAPAKKNKACDKARLQKRKQYDPRKAIMQQKKKKELKKAQLREPLQSDSIQIKGESFIVKEQNNPKIDLKKQAANNEKSIKAEVNASNNESIGQDAGLTRGTVAYTKTNKSKAEPKIDCWANRKTNKIKQPQENRSTYRAIHSKDHKVTYKSIDQIKQEPIVERNPDKQRAYKPSPSYQRSSTSNFQRMRGEVEMSKGRYDCSGNLIRERESQLRKVQSYPEMKAGRYIGRKKQEGEGHKYIEEIEAVYNNQYQSRMQKLLPKLTLLSAARQQESTGKIPVLTQSNGYVREVIKQNSSNNRFWLMASRIQKTFKDFDKF